MEFKYDAENITLKISSFIDSADRLTSGKGVSLETLIEDYFQVSYDSIGNLYTLKYYVEKEDVEEMDTVMRFLNSLIDLYSRGNSYALGTLVSVQELISSKDNSNILANVAIIKSLRENAGMAISPITKTVYLNGAIINTKKELMVQPDGSFLIQVKSNDELKSIYSEFMDRFYHMLRRDRADAVNERIFRLMDDGFFEGAENRLLCIYKQEEGKIKFTIGTDRYSVVDPDGLGMFQVEEVEVDGFPYEVCII